MFEARRVFQHHLYSPAALAETKEAYTGFIEATFEDVEGATAATFSGDEENGDIIVDAFCNHALFLTIQAHRQGSSE